MTDSGVDVSTTRESPITAFTSDDEVLNLWQPFAMDLDARSIHVFDLETGNSLSTTSGERTRS